MEDSLILNETTTVDEYLMNRLIARGLNAGEFERALEYAKQKLDASGFQIDATMAAKQGQRVVVKDCWNTLAIDYTQEALAGLYKLIEHHAFTRCINYMHHLL